MKTYGAGWSKDSMQELANILGDGGQIFLGNQDDGSWEEVKPKIDKVKVDQEILSLTFYEQGDGLWAEHSSGDIHQTTTGIVNVMKTTFITKVTSFTAINAIGTKMICLIQGS